MTSEHPRTARERRAHAEEVLSVLHADAWVATASAEGKEHLVPLSIAWDGTRLIVATSPEAVTTRNVRSSGRARVAAGSTRDVVMIDAVLEDVVAVADAPPTLAETFAAESDWDPRHSSGYLFLVLRPSRVLVWRDEAEIAGRTVMRDGEWID